MDIFTFLKLGNRDVSLLTVYHVVAGISIPKIKWIR